MATERQELGALGERLVVQTCVCPKCKQRRTLKPLRTNFKCADVICDFCGYLAQVKASTSKDGKTPPKRLLGAAWEPQRVRMEAGIYFPLFLVLVTPTRDFFSIHYLPADLQDEAMFLPREPLSVNARRAGWRGFNYDLEAAGSRLIHVTEGRLPLRQPKAADVTY
jgi:type II restriction enzyme